MNISNYSLNNYSVNNYNDSFNYDNQGGSIKDESSDVRLRSMKRSGQVECETCKNRKYQDGSDEMVSFKAPGHIDPGASAGVVRAHEQEHVSNAFIKADGIQGQSGEVVSANVTLKTSICPECGRTYVSGGETVTQIKYKEDNQYSYNAKLMDIAQLQGNNVDYYV